MNLAAGCFEKGCRARLQPDPLKQRSNDGSPLCYGADWMGAHLLKIR